MNAIFPNELCLDYYNILCLTQGKQSDKNKLMRLIRGDDSIKYDPDYYSWNPANWDKNRLYQQFIDFNKIIPLSEETIGNTLKNLDKAGESNFDVWDDITSFYWGTPLNGYDQHCSPGVVKFHTLLRPAIKIILHLSRIFPDVELDYKYSFITPGEGQAGHLIIHDGYIAYQNTPEKGSNNSFQLSFYILNFDSHGLCEYENGRYRVVSYSHFSGDRFDKDRYNDY